MQTENGSAVRSAVVVGGGVIGAACALNLQARGIDTLVVDPVSVRRAASWGNAGHIAVEQVEPLASLKTIRSFPSRLFWRGGALGLPVRSVAAWLPFAMRLIKASHPNRFEAGKAALRTALATSLPAWRRLLQTAGASDLLLEQGHFVVWETPESAVAGRAAWARTDTGSATFRDATDDELAILSAQMACRPAGAIRFIGSGHVADPEAIALALENRFAQLGGDQRCARARGIEVVGEIASVALDGGDIARADAVVIAAGVASAGLLEPLGHKVPIIAERGYHIQTAHTDWPADLPPVVFEDRSMIVTRFRSGLRAASFVEFSRSDSPPDPRKWARLRQHVRSLGLSFGDPAAEWIGARPTLPDYLPAIGRSNRASNLFYAFGHQHLGLTLAATTGEAIGALVTGVPPAIDLSAFRLERF
jgi:D-amino-acid dehydrogenase